MLAQSWDAEQFDYHMTGWKPIPRRIRSKLNGIPVKGRFVFGAAAQNRDF